MPLGIGRCIPIYDQNDFSFEKEGFFRRNETTLVYIDVSEAFVKLKNKNKNGLSIHKCIWEIQRTRIGYFNSLFFYI